jgi:hypothetical protein
MSDVVHELPPYVYLPCRVETDDVARFDPMLRPTAVGGTGLIAYTALDRLRRAVGRDHPWVVVPITTLTELRARLGFDALLLDDGLEEWERALG